MNFKSKLFLTAVAVFLVFTGQARAAGVSGILNAKLPQPGLNTGLLPSSSSTSALYGVYSVVLKLGQAIYRILANALGTLNKWFQAVTGVTSGNFFLDIWNLLLWLLNNILKILQFIAAWVSRLGK